MSLTVGLLTGAGVVAGGAALGVWHLTHGPRVAGVPVLRYRLIGSPRPGSPLNDLRVPVSKFEAQIRHLARRGYRPVSLEEAIAGRADPAFLRTNPLALTFDGAYESFYRAAWPILRRYGLTQVTLFFPPDRLGQTELLFAEGRPEPVLSLEQLAKLAVEGVTFGVLAGTRDQDDRESLATGFVAGRKALQALTQQDVATLALPFPTLPATEAARDAGFVGVALLGEGVLGRDVSPFKIPRFPVQPNSTLLDVALVVSRRLGDAPW